MQLKTYKAIYEDKFGVGEQNIKGYIVTATILPYKDIRKDINRKITTPYILDAINPEANKLCIIIPQEYVLEGSYDGMMFIVYHLMYRSIDVKKADLYTCDRFAYNQLTKDGCDTLNAFDDAVAATICGIKNIHRRRKAERLISNFMDEVEERKERLIAYDKVQRLYSKL